MLIFEMSWIGLAAGVAEVDDLLRREAVSRQELALPATCHCGSTAPALTVWMPPILSISSALFAAERSNFSSIRAAAGP